MRTFKVVYLKTAVGLLCSGVLLFTGGTLLYRDVLRPLWHADGGDLQVSQAPEPVTTVTGQFPAQALTRFAFQAGKPEAFSLLLADYQGEQQREQALLFPQDSAPAAAGLSATGIRHTLWEEAAQAIRQHAPKEALFLSWWDDGQRIMFLSGQDAWLRQPTAKSLMGPIWTALQPHLQLAPADNAPQLTQMAAWLTMDSEQAITAIRQQFGSNRPLYLLVSTDLLLRQAELRAYGGQTLQFNSKSFPVGKDVHGDIAQVKRWAGEENEGNYLVQKEGAYYRAWTPIDPLTQASLLVRLLPFISSLKQLPTGVTLVYQSAGGGYLSVYQLTP